MFRAKRGSLCMQPRLTTLVGDLVKSFVKRGFVKGTHLATPLYTTLIMTAPEVRACQNSCTVSHSAICRVDWL